MGHTLEITSPAELAAQVKSEAHGVEEALDILATRFVQAARLIDPTITGGGKQMDMTRLERIKGRVAPLVGVYLQRA